MASRTWVNLTVHTVNTPIVDTTGSHYREGMYQAFPNGFTTYYYEDILNGELNFLPKLERAGIPYNSEWGENCRDGAGAQYGRFNEKGEPYVVIINNKDRLFDVEDLMKVIDEPEKLKDLILSCYMACQVPDWEHQLEYAKRYILRGIISPSFPRI